MNSMNNEYVSKKEKTMAKIITSLTEIVGNTPLMELVNYERNHKLNAKIYAKLEYLNPSGSVKDRAALYMIEAAEREGKIKPGDTIVDQTSGNTGIGLATFAASKGYNLEIVLEDGASAEREQILKAFGVKLRHFSDVPGVTEMIKENRMNSETFMQAMADYCEEHEGNCYYINQVTNYNNPLSHIETTGPEIWDALDGKVDIVVAMIGTGGTIYGLEQYFHGKNPDIQIVAVQPTPDSRLTSMEEDKNVIDGVTGFTDVPESMLTVFIKEAMEKYDEYIDVSGAEAYKVARELARTEGLFMGTSSAAALFAAEILAKRPENAGKNIVVIMPDNGFKYLSTKLYEI